MTKVRDVTGERFGRLLAIAEHYPRRYRKARRWLCRCDCGNMHVVSFYDLARCDTGRGVLSCGCLQKERARESSKREFSCMKDGVHTPEYRSWKAMKNRCLDPSDPCYPGYGGRGIKICDEWINSFAAFRKFMGPRPSAYHTIDRINVNGHYESGNVRWASKQEQARNRTNNVYVTIQGERSAGRSVRAFRCAA
jgi:hypothetical protein